MEAAGLREQLADARSLTETTRLSAQSVRAQLEAARVRPPPRSLRLLLPRSSLHCCMVTAVLPGATTRLQSLGDEVQCRVSG